MRLYLSSYRVGDRPEELSGLLREGCKTALISNALDHVSAEDRSASVAEQVSTLEALGLEATELDLRDWFDSPAEVEETLRGFDLLWVRGGNTFILRRALVQNGADNALVALLRRDAIAYAGYSAGYAS